MNVLIFMNVLGKLRQSACFIYFLGCAGSLLLGGRSLVVVSWGSSSCSAQASYLCGSSGCRAWALGPVDSRSCGTRAQLLRLLGSGAQAQ